MKKNILLISTIALFSLSNLLSQSCITIGPTFHIMFGSTEKSLTYGIETALWYKHNTQSIDFGIEFNKKKLIIYSEGQLGLTPKEVAIAGISIGPYIELSDNPEFPFLLGIQGTIWGNLVGGFDLRGRYSKNGFEKFIGTYLKVVTPKYWKFDVFSGPGPNWPM